MIELIFLETNANIRITVRLVGDVAMGDYSYLQLFNIIMRKCLGHLKLQLVGRNFFDALAKVIKLIFLLCYNC